MLRCRPASLKESNELVKTYHRHHKPVVGQKFSILACDDEKIVGAVIVGRPVARAIDHRKVAEVTRLVTDGTKNACSMLYSAAARACAAMGYETIQTYILDSEPGTSLKASGWKFDGKTKGRDWNCPSRGGRRTDQPMVDKQRWKKDL